VDEKERENIENELKILQKLRHINIVSYKDSFTDKEGNLCIVMVYCELGDMHSKIKQTKEKGKNFTESQILDWITQIALAIYYLHNQKILHRDLKTQNLFLKKDDRIKDDRIKLGDFGIAKVLDSTQDLARTCIGTPYYMAPEIFKYKPYSYKR
jgi:non-specific serine/threonine protein kinase/NIMA (never in mitosis gene a)-related kinase